MTTETVVPPAIAWKVRPGDQVAHAFSAGPGWMRSVCRAVAWSAAVREPAEDATQCDDCALLVDGAPGEIMEAYGS